MQLAASRSESTQFRRNHIRRMNLSVESIQSRAPSADAACQDRREVADYFFCTLRAVRFLFIRTNTARRFNVLSTVLRLGRAGLDRFSFGGGVEAISIPNISDRSREAATTCRCPLRSTSYRPATATGDCRS